MASENCDTDSNKDSIFGSIETPLNYVQDPRTGRIIQIKGDDGATLVATGARTGEGVFGDLDNPEDSKSQPFKPTREQIAKTLDKQTAEKSE